MRTLVATIFFILQPISSYWAQEYELIVEEYAVGIVPGYTTLRFFQSMENEDDFLSSIYGGALEPLSITTNTGFYNDAFGASVASGINPAFFAFFPTIAGDSWVTIGIDSQNTGSEVPISTVESINQPWTPCFAWGSPQDGQNVIMNDDTGGAWYVPNGSPNGLPDEQGRVLFMQLTIQQGSICSIVVNTQVFQNGAASNSLNFTHEWTNGCEFQGCMDSSACNYDIEAECDNGSCLYFDVCGNCDGSGYPEGTCDCNGTLPEDGYDCEGICITDVDNDGVCDEFEINGCQDSSACNYDSAATDDDGSCLYTDVCGVCGGNGIAEGACDCEGNGPAAGYDCEGICITDVDNDGVCDEFEINGCQDSIACNYDSSATDAGYCDYSCLVSNALELKGVMDFTTPFGGVSGKAIHLYASESIEDLGSYGLGIANNGGGSDGEEFQFQSVFVAEGSHVLVLRNFKAMESYLGGCFDQFDLIILGSSAIDMNGDDAIELYSYGTLIETFGDPNVDGTGESWEYIDSWAFKSVSGWIYGEINCTDGTQTIYETSCLYPICEVVGCTDVEACNFLSTAITDDGSCIYPETGYDCIGQCLEDDDSDGVCNEFEILGCTNELACNFSSVATEDDGSCAELDQCGVCGGNGIQEGQCDCEGNVLDECGVCGGAGIPEGDCDCLGNTLDECGVCGGNGIADGTCDCDGNLPATGYDCSGNCLSDENGNGVCDYLELEAIQTDLEEGVYCGEGTIWDAELGECIAYNPCPKDLNGDGVIGVEDLLQLLNAFGTDCPDPNEPATVEWTCGEPFTYQGYDYATVQIGEQCWFAENLRAGHYTNGDAIPANLSDGEWGSTTSGAVAVYGEDSGCNNYSPDGNACDPDWSLNEYGRLYNWYAVDDERGLCPTGWHVPTDEEWMTLEMALGMSESEANSTGWRGTDQGTQMKATYGWYVGGNGTNSSSFSGLPGGYRMMENGYFSSAGAYGAWWSISPSGSLAWYRSLTYNSPNVNRDYYNQHDGISVRCLRDSE